jgi:hypothetical protein
MLKNGKYFLYFLFLKRMDWFCFLAFIICMHEGYFFFHYNELINTDVLLPDKNSFAFPDEMVHFLVDKKTRAQLIVFLKHTYVCFVMWY